MAGVVGCSVSWAAWLVRKKEFPGPDGFSGWWDAEGVVVFILSSFLTAAVIFCLK